MLAKHILPALGKLKVADVERKHILAFQYELHEKPTVANRALDMLIKMFNLAEAWELRPPGKNPCRLAGHLTGRPHGSRSPALDCPGTGCYDGPDRRAAGSGGVAASLANR